MHYYPLQEFVFPNLALSCPDEMYARAGAGSSLFSHHEKRIHFAPFAAVSLDTFFNSFSVKVWKKNTDLSTLYLKIIGTGEFKLRVGLHQRGVEHKILQESAIHFDEHGECLIPIEAWGELRDGMLYPTLVAKGDASLLGGGFFTADTPLYDVKLGVVITHFNRKKQTLPAIARISKELLSDNRYQEKIQLVVVDNSNNISADEATGATIIPNKNYGGSGGFMRGLMYLKDHGFTHCLFMDDDASCEIESIRRAYQLHAYSITPRMAVAGSLLLDVMPYYLHEKGAKMSLRYSISLHNKTDMRDIGDLLDAEHEKDVAEYGGWWFFAFKLADVTQWAFPFFVRGDDIGFGLWNKFNIVTNNGIACWGEDFGFKSGPMTSYLDMRQHLVHAMTHFDVGYSKFRFVVHKAIKGQLYSYNYASAEACYYALLDIMKGPSTFLENMDMTSKRAALSSILSEEKMVPINLYDYNLRYRNRSSSKLLKLITRLTLHGFALPSFCLSNKTTYQKKWFTGSAKDVFMSKRILYYYEALGYGYIAKHDKKRFFALLFKLGVAYLKLALNYKKLKKSYQEAWPEMTRESFWRGVYKTPA